MRRRVGRWSVLSVVLAVMLVGVVAVQVANFALLQLVPLPQPPVFSVSQVAGVLRQKRLGGDQFRFSLAEVPPPQDSGRGIPIGRALAASLGVATDRVRVGFVDPLSFGRGGPRNGPPGLGRRDRPDSLMVGDFTAGVRLADGRWFIAQPRQSGLVAWRIGLLFWLFVALATVAPFAWAVARWVTRPIALFADAAERIGHNPHTSPLAVGGPREIANAANAMNEMQERLNRYVDDRTVMIGAIAHDLRTPLMRMALRLERAPDELRLGVERDVADMQAMIAAVTNYVRGAASAVVRRRIELRSLIESAADDMIDQGASVTVLPGDPIVIEADPVALRSAVDNLLTNAIRYAGAAELSVSKVFESVAIEVRDYGPGLPEAELEQVFEPFFRSEGSRNRDSGGMGLGLASVRGVARQHHGTVTLRNHPDGGLSATIRLPG